jgi:acetyl esterase/lipase
MRRRYDVKARPVRGRPVYTLAPRNGASGQIVFYLHGGGYVAGFMSRHWVFLAQLMDALGCTIVAPDYPLAPAGHVDDVFAFVLPLYRKLVARFGADHLTVMGDSAGGGLGLALAERIRDEGLPQPNDIVLLSPWLDVTMTNPAIREVEKLDPFMAAQGAIDGGELYAGEVDRRDPRVSPLYGDLRGLAPITVFTGTHDILNPDAKKLRDRAARVGARLDYREYEELPHVWVLLPIPEATVAIQEICAILGRTPVGESRPPGET